jgi:hypothetical protein
MCCAATGLANVYFGLFFLFGECEHLIKWLANLAPNAAFKQVGLNQQRAPLDAAAQSTCQTSTSL